MNAEPTRDDRLAPRASLGRFLVMYVVLVAILIPFGVGSVRHAQYWWWMEEIRAPDLQRQLGFRTERRLLPGEHYWGLFFVEVQPDSPFDRAGVRVGDRLACWESSHADFWGSLDSIDYGYESRFRVVSPDRAAEGCMGARLVQIAPRRVSPATGGAR